MNKTPVSILQEMMVKKLTVPNYELIHDGGGSHMNTFTFRVSCDGFTATGTGRCKKDAKHEAAKAMLETIAEYRGYPQLPASPAQSPIRTPLPAEIPAFPKIPANVPFINAIGALQDLCAENDLQEAEYHAISDVGPPHARVFTVQCIVSTFKEEGVATTKKQAKHDAAKKMLDRITDVLSEVKKPDGICYSLQKEENERQEIMATEIAIARYVDNDLCKLPITKKNLGVKVSEYHLKLKKNFENQERCDAIININCMLTEIEDVVKSKNYNEFECKLKVKFQKFLMTSLSVEAKKTLIKSRDDDACPSILISIHLNTCPEITEIGCGRTEINAEIHATARILQTLQLLFECHVLPEASDLSEKKDCSL